jgi:hypothetical protein
MKKRGRKNSKGIAAEVLPWLIISLITLAILLVVAFILKGKGFEFIDRIKDIFRGR